LFDPIVDKLGELAGRIQPPLLRLANTITNTLLPVFTDLANAIAGETDKIDSLFIKGLVKGFQTFGTIVGGVFTATVVVVQGWGVILGGVLSAVNSLLGTSITGFDVIATLLAGKLFLAIAGFLIGLKSVVTVLALLRIGIIALTAVSAPWLAAIGLITGAMAVLISQMTPEQWQAFGEVVVGVWTAIKDAVTGVINELVEAWTSARDQIIEALQPVIGFFDNLIGKIKQAIEFSRKLASSFGGGGGQQQGQGFAHGGRVRGPGTSRSDSIIARVSDGEFINRARAVQYYGVRFFERLNNLQLPRFAEGGSVGITTPAVEFAGQRAGSTRVLNLTLPDGTTFNNMLIDDDTADRVISYAVRKKTRSAGRRPNWSGGGK
jgi:hypothetical protein